MAMKRCWECLNVFDEVVVQGRGQGLEISSPDARRSICRECERTQQEIRERATSVAKRLASTARPNGLGALQARLLVEIYERSLDYHQHPDVWPWSHGVNWGSPANATRSAQAARSRALARLEASSLVKRLNWVSGKGRMTHVQIQPTGIAIAEQLTNQRGVWLLTVGTLTVPKLRPMTVEEFTHARERISSETLH